MAAIMARSHPAPLLVISGAAGTGKTTLAQAWSTATGHVIVDLDDETSDIVREVLDAHPQWSEAQALTEARDDRYVRLVDSVHKARWSDAIGVVAVAPFTREIHDEQRWREFVDRCGGGDVTLIWLWLDPEVRNERIRQRAAGRDSGRRDIAGSLEVPVVEHLAVNSEVQLEEQIHLLRSHLGNGPFI